MEVDVAQDGLKFLNEIILNNAALYTTELNTWSLEYYIENAAYRLNHARQLAIEGQVDDSLLPRASALRESENDALNDNFLQSSTVHSIWQVGRVLDGDKSTKYGDD